MPAIPRPLHEEAVTPHFVPMACPMAEISVCTSASYLLTLAMLSRHLHTLLLQDPMNPLGVHLPAVLRLLADTQPLTGAWHAQACSEVDVSLPNQA